ncbi:MAG: hypothetical protein WDM77_21070 [Steroidobacteraceae bacterium]
MIQTQTAPAATADESRQIKTARRAIHQFDVFAEPRLEASGRDAIAAVILQE